MAYDDYLHIDLEKTGRRLEGLIRHKGYSVRDIQDILHLSCPQPIYRWMRGQILPSVDHLYVLARVLQVHMEELLIVARPESAIEEIWAVWRRMAAYNRRYIRLEAA